VVSTKALSTTGQMLTITADDLDVNGGVSSGTAALQVAPMTNLSLGMGTQHQQLNIVTDELGWFDSSGMTFGSGGVNQGIKVIGVSETNSNGIREVLTLIATFDRAQIRFESTGSTFAALSAQADDGIYVTAPVTATVGGLYLDGDFDDSSVTDLRSDIVFANDIILTAKEAITVEATTGSLTPEGALTLRAGSGITIMDNMNQNMNPGNPIIFATDY
jgi:hypothetical protein